MLALIRDRTSEAVRLLRLARLRRPQIAQVEALLARHRQLLQAGVELPAWATGSGPRPVSWAHLLGLASRGGG